MIQTNPTAFLKNTMREARLRAELQGLLDEQMNYQLVHGDQTMGWGIKWNPIKDISNIASDVGNFVGNAVSGGWKAIEGVGQSIFKSIEHFGETIALTARAAVGDVKWDRVLREAGKVTNEIGNIIVLQNPYRYVAEVLKKSELTAHAFNELDKFTGGMVTTAVNVSDLPARAMRGDPIPKEELLKDALFAIQVAVIVGTVGTGTSAAIALGTLVGGMVGREVCKHQTEHQAECMAVFQILGALAGDYLSAAENVAFQQAVNTATKEAVNQCKKSKFLGTKECEVLGQVAASYVTSETKENWVDYFTRESEKLGVKLVLNEATKAAQQACHNQNWTGDAECDALGNMLSKYIMTTEPRPDWEKFVAEEAARLGVLSLANRLFPPPAPPKPPEPDFKIVYSDIEVPGPVIKKSNTGLVVAASVGAALLIAAGVS